jgi:hypothetical protein
MNDLNAARQWHETAHHLVQAHGARSAILINYGPTLEQLRFVHADTHRALGSVDMLPPDQHTHPLPIDAGYPDARETSYRPFPPSASVRDDRFLCPLPFQTGLPCTWESAMTETDLADWAAMRPLPLTCDYVSAIKRHAASATARWLASASFPGPVQARASRQQGRGVPAAPRRQAASMADGARQACPRSTR